MTLFYIYLIVLEFCLIAGMYNYTHLSNGLIIINILTIVTFNEELINLYIAINKGVKAPVYHIYSIIEVSLTTLYFLKTIGINNFKLYAAVVFIVWAAIGIANIIFLQPIPVSLDIAISKAMRTGNNIAAYIDNKAPYTVIIGAHYDHLGFGEDGNSLFANAVKEHQIHHGADDNASGTAALIEMARRIKKNKKKLHHYNYLFINFSGEELGLYGSKAFVKDQAIDSTHIAYMINMDMVGRLNDSTHALTLGGVGTSPVWAEVVNMGGSDFKLNIDSSGIGPSDHTSFYNAGIPVLFFFTGTHHDYHKPSDTAGAINYAGEVTVLKYVQKVVTKMDKENVKPPYVVTKQQSIGKTSFKVTLGIMPDYTFETGGVRVDGVSDNRPAMKAGIKQGDIITKLGDNKVNGMQTYMEALGKFAPGDKTKVTVTRDGKEIEMPIELSK